MGARVGVMNYRWRVARYKANFNLDQLDLGWPEHMTTSQVAELQITNYFDSELIKEQLDFECRNGFIQHTVGSFKVNDHCEIYSHLIDAYYITALTFFRWLKKNNIEPSEHIQAWFDAYGVSQEAAPTVNAAPVLTVVSANEEPNNLDQVEWTPERLKKTREAFEGDGKGRPMQRLVEASGIKERKIRRLIAETREPEINPNSLFQFSPRQNAGHRRA